MKRVILIPTEGEPCDLKKGGRLRDAARHESRFAARWWGTAILAAMLAWSSPSRALDLAGIEWSFDGNTDNPRLKADLHLTVSSRRKALKGTACCEQFTVAFPAPGAFSLRHRGYEIVTGTLRAGKSGYVLEPDAGSRARLAWWLENESEFFWNIGVFDLSLALRLDTTRRSAMGIQVKTVGGEMRATLKVDVSAGGAVVSFDPTRVRGFATGPTRVTARYVVRLSYVGGIEESAPYPPIVPCDSDNDIGRMVGISPRNFPGPDYCR